MASLLVRRLAGLTVIVGGIALGIWQLGRDDERNADRTAALAVESLPIMDDAEPVGPGSAWRIVRWHGRYGAPVRAISGRTDGGDLSERGYGVAQPFTRVDGSVILVDRGWVSADGVGAAAATLGADGREVEITGQLRPLEGRGEGPPLAHPSGVEVWPPSAIPAVSRASGATIGLLLVTGKLDGSPTPEALTKDGFERVPERDFTSLHYAFQWFGIAAIGGVLLLVRKFPAIG